MYGTNGPEKKPCDEARDYWENRKGRWVRVHGIARRTLFDPMHDEQPFCQGLTERRRTTVRFLGQQSEVTIDDTWPQAGEMRNRVLDRRHATGRHLETQQTSQQHDPALSQSRDSKNAVAMFPPPPSPVISVEHGYRDSRLSAVPHIENAEEKRRRVVLEMSEVSNVYRSHHYETSRTTVSQDAATEAADPGCQRQDTSKGMPTPPGQALVKWHEKGKYVSAVRGHQQRQGRDHWNQQIGPEETGDRRGETASQQDGGGTHGAGSGAGRG